MTREQKEWLDRNKHFRAVGRAPGNCRWVDTGMLHPDGTFEKATPGRRPGVKPGSFEVGVLELIEHDRQ